MTLNWWSVQCHWLLPPPIRTAATGYSIHSLSQLLEMSATTSANSRTHNYCKHAAHRLQQPSLHFCASRSAYRSSRAGHGASGRFPRAWRNFADCSQLPTSPFTFHCCHVGISSSSTFTSGDRFEPWLTTLSLLLALNQYLLHSAQMKSHGFFEV